MFIALGGSSHALSGRGFLAAHGTLSACVTKNSGAVRLVHPGTACRPRELSVSWDQKGPSGDPGPTGPKGDPGTSANLSIYTVAARAVVQGGTIAYCRPGDVAVGGGGLDETNIRGGLAASEPQDVNKPDGWFVLGTNGDDSFDAIAVCAHES